MAIDTASTATAQLRHARARPLVTHRSRVRGWSHEVVVLRPVNAVSALPGAGSRTTAHAGGTVRWRSAGCQAGSHRAPSAFAGWRLSAESPRPWLGTARGCGRPGPPSPRRPPWVAHGRAVG